MRLPGIGKNTAVICMASIKRNVMNYQSWSENSIKEHILARKDKEPLNSQYTAVNYPDVYAAAVRTFGSWKHAIEACGLNYAKIRLYKRWTQEVICAHILQLQKKGENLTSKNIQQNHRSLYLAALRRFQGWDKALAAAGIDYTAVRERRRDSPEQLRRKIKQLAQRGESLRYADMREKHLALLATATRKLGNGSWCRALLACGIKYQRKRNHQPLTFDQAAD